MPHIPINFRPVPQKPPTIVEIKKQETIPQKPAPRKRGFKVKIKEEPVNMSAWDVSPEEVMEQISRVI